MAEITVKNVRVVDENEGLIHAVFNILHPYLLRFRGQVIYEADVDYDDPKHSLKRNLRVSGIKIHIRFSDNLLEAVISKLKSLHPVSYSVLSLTDEWPEDENATEVKALFRASATVTVMTTSTPINVGEIAFAYRDENGEIKIYKPE